MPGWKGRLRSPSLVWAAALRRAAGYWKAYRKRAGVVHSAYLGKTIDLTLERLQGAAASLANPTLAADASRQSEPALTGTARERVAHPVPAFPTGTVTFLFTDIEGSTQRWEQHPELMRDALAHHDMLLHQTIAAHGGVIFKTIGDAICAAFASTPAALPAALASQRALITTSWGSSSPLRVRMALHTGSVEVYDGEYLGLPLSRAARLLATAYGGQILLSLATQELVRDHLPPATELRDMGTHRLKDLIRPEHIHQLVVADLPASFPPLQTLASRQNNLPAQHTPLIGREREVVTACTLLRRDDVHLLTLSGPGGTGKTRLALQVAADLLDTFTHGVFFVALAPISDPNMVLTTIAQALEVVGISGEALIASLKTYLHNKHILLVLDNFEQIVEAAPLLGELLAVAPRLKLLVTSRTMLRLSGEHEFAVPPLVLPDRNLLPPLERLTQYAAVQLFIARAQAVKTDFTVTNANAPAVAEICHRLDGLPLAIELAAARVKLFSPLALLERLHSSLSLLTGGARDVPARQQTLRNTIDWSFRLLNAGEQALFARLGVFVGGCTLQAAEVVCNSQLAASAVAAAWAAGRTLSSEQAIAEARELARVPEPSTVAASMESRAYQAVPPSSAPLVEPLSERELEVLRLIAAGHSNQAIADTLIVAVSTVKRHINNLYGKLGVQSRTQALVRARELKLL
jgi:predicted ATPase/class 3 adenylate cyclase/DNA-binding CsgD family transcriptional regulator